MANVTKTVLPVFQKLTEEWDKKPPNLDECGKLLASLKVHPSGGCWWCITYASCFMRFSLMTMHFWHYHCVLYSENAIKSWASGHT